MHAPGLGLAAIHNRTLTEQGCLPAHVTCGNMSWVCISPDANYHEIYIPAASTAVAIAVSVTSTAKAFIATPAATANTAYLAAFPAC